MQRWRFDPPEIRYDSTILINFVFERSKPKVTRGFSRKLAADLGPAIDAARARTTFAGLFGLEPICDRSLPTGKTVPTTSTASLAWLLR
jgi:hypothetical protein